MRNYDLSLAEIQAMPPGIEKALQLAVCGLLEIEVDHKQWFLEQILLALGEDLPAIREALEHINYAWEPGISP